MDRTARRLKFTFETSLFVRAVSKYVFDWFCVGILEVEPSNRFFRVQQPTNSFRRAAIRKQFQGPAQYRATAAQPHEEGVVDERGGAIQVESQMPTLGFLLQRWLL